VFRYCVIVRRLSRSGFGIESGSHANEAGLRPEGAPAPASGPLFALRSGSDGVPHAENDASAQTHAKL